MKIKENQLKIMKWTARILSLIIILLGLPFYLGYGNPLPFADANYTALDNLWLMVFPIMFIGLVIGWKWEKLAGFLIVVSLGIGLVIAKGIMIPMLISLIPGILYLIVGYSKKRKQ